MLAGYARVSTLDQNPDLQLDALRAAGCERIFEDRASGARADRPGLARALDWLREGDALVVWRLDRLGRSLPQLVATVRQLEERGFGFRSLTEGIDTTTASGTLVFHVFGALAQFERDLVGERTLAGLAAARERGRTGGRPSKLTPELRRQAEAMLRDSRGLCCKFGLRLKKSEFFLFHAARRSSSMVIASVRAHWPNPKARFNHADFTFDITGQVEAAGLTFAQGMHHFEAFDRGVGRSHRLEPAHRADQLFELAVVGLHDVVEIFDLTMLHVARALVFGLQFGQGDSTGRGFVRVDHPWSLPIFQVLQCLAKEAFRRLCIACRRQVEINRVTKFIDRPVKIRPFPTHLDIGLVHPPTA